jgi:hypothetical protein
VVVSAQFLAGSGPKSSSLHAISPEADSMIANTEYIVVFITLFIDKNVKRHYLLSRKVFESITCHNAYILVVI